MSRLSDDEIKQELEKTYTIDIKVEGEKLIVVSRPKTNRRKYALNISFNITVPQQISSDLRSTNGSISVNNLSGSHNFQTTNGSLKVDNVSGDITGRTTNGSISATNSNGKITVTTTNGNINLRDVSGVISTRATNGRVLEHNTKRE